ncbi:hypothetical protein OQA88_9399 [Cercophora sp. LCS_1]
MSSPGTEDERFIPLVEGIGQLDLGDDGKWEYHGLSSGAAYFGRIMKDHPELLSYDPRTPFLPQAPRPYMALPLGSLGNSSPGLAAHPCYHELPPRNLARTLCEYSFNCATCVLRTVHTPSFYQRFDHLYNTGSQGYNAEQRRFQGLLYAVLALGSMYDVDEKDPTNPNHYAVAMDRGFQFYISARLCLDDLTECGDMTTLQAMVFIALFLQATANLTGCHTFVGIAVRSALRMGLHRHLPHAQMTPIEVETRRRVFHVIRQMDIYLSTTLGLPLLLQDKDIDQPLPTEVDDNYITEFTIHTPAPATPSFFHAFNAHAKLMKILAKVVEHLYPPTGVGGGASDVTYMISYTRIKEIEQDLHNWCEHLPVAWRPGPIDDTQVVRIRVLLRFAYAHVQMMLYRPFLRRPPPQGASDQALTEVTHARQATGISVCRNIIHIGLEIRKQRVLIGPHWFMMYTEFLAVVSLVLYVLNNPSGPACSEILADAQLGRAAIQDLTQRSLPADRMAVALDCLFERLPAGLIPETAGPPENMQDTHVPPAHGQCGLTHTEIPISGQELSINLITSAPSSDTMMFPEDPFAYPQLEGPGAVAQGDASVDQGLTQLRLFPELCGVTEAQLLNPLSLTSRD